MSENKDDHTFVYIALTILTGGSFDDNESTMGDRLTYIPLLASMEGNQEFLGEHLSSW
jgi:hypothetical protein